MQCNMLLRRSQFFCSPTLTGIYRINRMSSASRFLSQNNGDEKRSIYVRKSNRLTKYVLARYEQFVSGYEKILETRFPKAFKVYQVFAVGLKEFYRDMLEYMRISRELKRGKQFKDLTRKEIEVYSKMPKELRKAAPVLVLASFPFTNYIIFPVAYFFPRHFLTSHFWSLQQKTDFAVIEHRSRLYQFRPIFRSLQAKLDSVEDPEMKAKCNDIFAKLGSGTHPTVEEILETVPLFIDKPFGLQHLNYSHMVSLCRLYGLSTFGFRRRRLWYHAGIVKQMDLAMQREEVSNMNQDELRAACFQRGVNPVGMTRQNMADWLNLWISVTSQLDSRSLSLLLHCPVLLAYNHPTNWTLIH